MVSGQTGYNWSPSAQVESRYAYFLIFIASSVNTVNDFDRYRAFPVSWNIKK